MIIKWFTFASNKISQLNHTIKYTRNYARLIINPLSSKLIKYLLIGPLHPAHSAIQRAAEKADVKLTQEAKLKYLYEVYNFFLRKRDQHLEKQFTVKYSKPNENTN